MPAAAKRSVLALALLLGIAGCTDPIDVDRRLGVYIGRTEAQLIADLGVPNRSYQSDGLRFLQYDGVGHSPAVGITPSIGFGVGNFGWGGGGWGVGTGIGFGLGGYPSVTDACSVVFALDEGRVVGYDRVGPDCPTLG